jgi:hypothetical protein
MGLVTSLFKESKPEPQICIHPSTWKQSFEPKPKMVKCMVMFREGMSADSFTPEFDVNSNSIMNLLYGLVSEKHAKQFKSVILNYQDGRSGDGYTSKPYIRVSLSDDSDKEKRNKPISELAEITKDSIIMFMDY